MKLWAGRFSKETNALVDEYNASINFDFHLAPYDIVGSIAHVKTLAKSDLITADEALIIINGLLTIQQNLQQGKVTFNQADEDIHMNIERLLHEVIGDVAGKLHTGRSRNDQVALDMHLYLRDHLINIINQLAALLNVLAEIATDHIDTILPGYTHLQRAEPVRLAHHFLAYFAMFMRDAQRLMDSYARVNSCPLGAGALAGSGVNLDREYTAQLLNFDSIYENSLDAVSDRDFVVEFLANAALMMIHFSKLSEELILWSSQEFSFIEFDDAFCTGSSMMPQKKNPDVAELARGKSGRVVGALTGLLVTLKGLPLAYNKDMQEDKEGLFDTVKTICQTLSVYTAMLSSMKINQEQMYRAAENDYSNATALANYLTEKGLPFRQAHEITGNIVRHCIEHHQLLKELSIMEFQNFYPQIDNDIYSVLSIEAVVDSHQVRGGTAKNSVVTQIKHCKKQLQDLEQWIDIKKNIQHQLQLNELM